jgi:SAM-dependent methyltransferase
MKGLHVTATEANEAMIERTRRLAAARGVALRAAVCGWEQLVEQRWSNSFDAVWCVGNSIAHAPGQAARRAALGQMAGVLRPGGVLVLTSRNWELVRDEVSGLRIGDQLVERDGRRALVVYGWSLADSWDDRHHLDIAVAIVELEGKLSSHVERLAFWPFRYETLDADIRAAGLVTTLSTYDPTVDRYLVAAKPSWAIVNGSQSAGLIAYGNVEAREALEQRSVQVLAPVHGSSPKDGTIPRSSSRSTSRPTPSLARRATRHRSTSQQRIGAPPAVSASRASHETTASRVRYARAARRAANETSGSDAARTSVRPHSGCYPIPPNATT